jgi:hypothetical protein
MAQSVSHVPIASKGSSNDLKRSQAKEAFAIQGIAPGIVRTYENLI